MEAAGWVKYVLQAVIIIKPNNYVSKKRKSIVLCIQEGTVMKRASRHYFYVSHEFPPPCLQCIRQLKMLSPAGMGRLLVSDCWQGRVQAD